jgi:hypothetical protein
MTVAWRDEGDVHMLTNIHSPSAEGNLGDEKRNTLRPHARYRS